MTVLPMFPLGNVLMPGGPLSLHVFEDRYRQLVRDCVEAVDHEFGVVLIDRGHEVVVLDQTFSDPAFVGMDLSLDSIQASSVDPVVRTARFNSTTGAFTVPGRTAAVFTTTPRINGSVTQTASTTPVVHGTYVDVAVSLTNNSDADIPDAFAIVPIDPDTEYVMGSATGGAYPVNARYATQLIRERGLQGAEALSGLDLSGKSPDEVVAVAWAGPLALNETIDFGFTVKVTAMSGEVQHDVTIFDGATFLGSIASDPLVIVDNSDYTVNRSRRFNVDRDTFIDGSEPAAFNGDAQTMWVGFFNQMLSLIHISEPTRPY